MKIKSVKILGDNFRSLAANKLYEFNVSFREDRLSTKVFAGLNGSGKSNFLELFSEIFYFLEIYHLDTVSDEEKKSKNFGFEIEYFLPVKSSVVKINEVEASFTYDQQIKIVKLLGEKPEFSIITIGNSTFERVDENTHLLLPKKIIAYTSGQNELLSNPYYKLKYHYFKVFENIKKFEKGEEFAESHRLFFLDYNANFSIFISNMLLGDEKKIDLLKKILHIEKLKSFRITINTDDIYKKVLPVSETITENIEKLKLCSSTWIEKKVGKFNLLIFDFSIDSSTREAFAYYFKNSFTLFKVFYELEIFNLYLVDPTTRRQMLNPNMSLNISDEMPKPNPSRLVFRIEKIVISKIIDTEIEKDIYYKSLSDGEHQFNEVIGTVMMMQDDGCLFLMDEPDTHFNPKWRAKFIKTLNLAAANSYDSFGNIIKVRNQELILTTHSPFVISDSFSQDVYKFEKEKGLIEYTNPDFQVYGASISIILDEIFEKSEGISEMARKELKDMVENIHSMDDLRKVVERLNKDFGDSVEKFDLFSKLRNIKVELEKKEK
ncbi:restriction system-associated AAA family ATPase [Flavobacterium sp. FlaQc-48]|uniref:restriction system-associated AAA family ATPase n=1 Tax=Flavobacterium sp. FlaQc-48 TaxID=3374181 RepID=UPI003756D187